MKILQPAGWPRPKGYANGISASGRMIFTAGIIGWNPENQTIESDNFTSQTAQALRNVVAVLRAGGRATDPLLTASSPDAEP